MSKKKTFSSFEQKKNKDPHGQKQNFFKFWKREPPTILKILATVEKGTKEKKVLENAKLCAFRRNLKWVTDYSSVCINETE